MSNAASISYLGRVAQRRGKLANVDVIACEGDAGWQLLDNPRKLFPKLGQAELAGIASLSFNPGEILVFQAAPNTRPGGAHSRVTNQRVLPRFADLPSLGSLEAARVLFTKTGWDGGQKQSGLWVVRFNDDRALALKLRPDQTGKKLVASPNSLAQVQCLVFDEERVLEAPSIPGSLYDLDRAETLSSHDWSPGADYIAHVIRALAGADDPRLPELITWLELHRDDETGHVSATGAEQEKAFEALRSGELAERLAADRELMAAYIAAVRTDPAVSKAVAAAASETASQSQEAMLAKLRGEAEAEIAAERQRLEDELATKRTRVEQETRDLEASLQAQMHERLAQAEAKLEEESRERLSVKVAAAEQALQDKAGEFAKIAAEIEAKRQEWERERAALETQKSKLSEEIGAFEIHQADLQAQYAEYSQSSRKPARSDPSAFLELPQDPPAQSIDSAALSDAIAGVAILSASGKSLMKRFTAFMLAGEVPILGGAQRDDFILIAEALLASGRLFVVDADPTVLTAEDLWSRPGSGLTSILGIAAQSAAAGEAAFLIQLRGIDRSAARSWYPSLVSYSRKGLLPRRLMMFATLADETSEEAKALPDDACRLRADSALVDGAALVAPNLLGGGSAAIAFNFDPGPRPNDVSTALPALAELGVDLDLQMSLRVARAAVESAALNPSDERETYHSAQDFCRAVNRLAGVRLAETKSA